MKKLLSLFVLCLMAFLFVGCDQIADQIKNNNKDDDDKTQEETSEKLEISQTESEKKIEKLEENGYEISFRYSTEDDGEEDSGIMTIGVASNTMWFVQDNEGSVIVEDGNQIHIYSYSEGEYTFEYTLTSESEESLFETYKSLSNPWLYWANNYDGSLKKGTDASVAGRSCYTYNLDLGAVGGAYAGLSGISSYKYKIYVDKELGITMKVEASATVEGEHSSFSYEVTSFKTGSQVKAPTLPEPRPVDGEE